MNKTHVHMCVCVCFIKLTLQNNINSTICNRHINHMYISTMNKFNVLTIRRIVTTSPSRLASTNRIFSVI
jgi:hypothetical protein